MTEDTKNTVVRLSLEVVNAILAHLGNQPYTQVADIIHKLMADHAKHNPPEAPVAPIVEAPKE